VLVHVGASIESVSSPFSPIGRDQPGLGASRRCCCQVQLVCLDRSHRSDLQRLQQLATPSITVLHFAVAGSTKEEEGLGMSENLSAEEACTPRRAVTRGSYTSRVLQLLHI
jgi:hypothetical protein